MARSRWCSAMRARSARCFAHSAGAQPRSALRSPVPRVARPTPGLELLFSLRVRSPCCADRTAAPPAWRAPRTSSTRLIGMARCAAALRAPFAWLGSPSLSPFPSAGLEWPSLRAGATWRRSWQHGRRRWPPARSARSRARRAPRRVAAGPAGPRSTSARARSRRAVWALEVLRESSRAVECRPSASVVCARSCGSSSLLGARCALSPGCGTVSAVAWLACGCGADRQAPSCSCGVGTREQGLVYISIRSFRTRFDSTFGSDQTITTTAFMRHHTVRHHTTLRSRRRARRRGCGPATRWRCGDRAESNFCGVGMLASSS